GHRTPGRTPALHRPRPAMGHPQVARIPARLRRPVHPWRTGADAEDSRSEQPAGLGRPLAALSIPLADRATPPARIAHRRAPRAVHGRETPPPPRATPDARGNARIG